VRALGAFLWHWLLLFVGLCLLLSPLLLLVRAFGIPVGPVPLLVVVGLSAVLAVGTAREL
jgi:hypothetical protein